MLYHFLKTTKKSFHLIKYLYLYLGSSFSNYLPLTSYSSHFKRSSCLFLSVNSWYYLYLSLSALDIYVSIMTSSCFELELALDNSP